KDERAGGDPCRHDEVGLRGDGDDDAAEPCVGECRAPPLRARLDEWSAALAANVEDDESRGETLRAAVGRSASRQRDGDDVDSNTRDDGAAEGEGGRDRQRDRAPATIGPKTRADSGRRAERR